MAMADVTIRELRNHGGEVVDRVAAGEQVTITRAGRPVAELRPIPVPGLTAEQLLERWRHVQPVDPATLRADLDDIIDPSV